MCEQARPSAYAFFSTRFAGCDCCAIGLLRGDARGGVYATSKPTGFFVTFFDTKKVTFSPFSSFSFSTAF